MGCDIHGPWIEYQAYDGTGNVEETWQTVAEMDGTRDYRAFGLMAGVRDRAEPVVPVRRGRPFGMDYQARGHARDGDGSGRWGDPGDCHSASWLTLDEMRTVAEAYRQDDSDWSFVDLCVALMEETERRTGKPTRAVFCFDN